MEICQAHLKRGEKCLAEEVFVGMILIVCTLEIVNISWRVIYLHAICAIIAYGGIQPRHGRTTHRVPYKQKRFFILLYRYL